MTSMKCTCNEENLHLLISNITGQATYQNADFVVKDAKISISYNMLGKETTF